MGNIKEVSDKERLLFLKEKKVCDGKFQQEYYFKCINDPKQALPKEVQHFKKCQGISLYFNLI